MAARCEAALALVLALAACDRARPLLVCHNGNCAGEVDSSRDDTPEALAASLALRHEGRPPFDGVELDLLWHGDDEACFFAHGFDQADATPVPAADAADAVAAYLLATDEPSWNGERFVLELELKGEVGPGFRGHAPDDLAPHVECAFDAADRVRAAALAAGHDLEVIIDSGHPDVLRAALAHPGWEASGALASADFGAPAGITPNVYPLGDFPTDDLDVVSVYPGLLPHAQIEAIRSLDADLDVWMFTASSEILDAIEHLEPPRVITNEVLFLRRWIERP